MATCLCSTRALRIFVNDITGFAIRQQRLPSSLRQQKAYTFSTRTPFQRLETVRLVDQDLDDGFLPFDAVNSGSTIPATGAVEKVNAKASTESPEVDDEWHAELEILSPDAQTTATNDIGSPAVARVDYVSTQQLVQPSSEVEPQSIPIFPPDPTPMQTPSKAESRLRRKQRRQEAGKWKPSAQATMGDESDASTQNVLGKIEAMAGPALPKKKPKDIAKIRSKNTKTKEVKERRKSDEKAKAATGSTTSAYDKTKRDPWKVQKEALVNKFGETGWKPRKRLSPDTLEGIRALHKSDTAAYSTAKLSEQFKITPEAIRRILKSKWRPNEDEVEKRRQRWEKRGVKKWEEMSQQGAKPPARWRAEGVMSPAARGREERGIKGGRGREDGYVQWAEG
ncbi:Required for respiratory growth protein 9 mitochondrial [Saxophila tyrrhenica]|uniref:Required for respiratory growth protein 9, mitochondrial n=1 Tax=Saxophila tyrrhenica TaxID=1690608 RepID=A0AAV9PTR2_9PEZI|nr:Required for respiratory growth protein 9 mitochondrial [Saxophila tyrrhenica]